MALVKWDRERELSTMQEEMSRLLRLSRSRLLGKSLQEEMWQPPADIYEDDREVVVKMEIPGVPLSEIEVRIEGDTLVIQGERRLEREEKSQNYHRIESSYGIFRRSFLLPATVDQERMRADCDLGVLHVVLPKKEAEMREIDLTVER